MDYDNPSTVAQEAEPDSGAGENVSAEELSLKAINEATGRNYRTLADAKVGLKNTYDFVGEPKEKKDKTPNNSSLRNEVEQMRDELSRERFIKEYPEAETVADEVVKMSKIKGVSPREYYEVSPLKSVVERASSGGEPSGIESGHRIAMPTASGDMTIERFNNLPIQEQRKIITKLPEWNDAVPRGEYHGGGEGRSVPTKGYVPLR